MEPGKVVEWAVLILGSGAVTAVITAFVSRKKMGADVAQQLGAASVSMLQPMRSELERMAMKVESTTANLDKAQQRDDDLETQLTSTRRRLAECEALAERLGRQLTYYRDRYGPPPEDLR